MLKRVIIAVAAAISVLIVSGSAVVAQRIVERSYTPPTDESTYMTAAGYVPDAATAIKIAVAVWEPIYGRANIRRKRPFRATLRSGVWHVEGSLPRGYCGGVPEAEISKRDGRVLRVIHGR